MNIVQFIYSLYDIVQLEYVFYSAQVASYLLTLAKLTEKVCSSGLRAVVFFKDRSLLEEFDNVLWTYSTDTFIPHGESDPDYQTVWLTGKYENKNNADIAILVGDFSANAFENVKKTLFFFSKDQKDCALATYEELKKNKKSVNYWSQSEKGWTNNFN